jgi:hypothetical protein
MAIQVLVIGFGIGFTVRRTGLQLGKDLEWCNRKVVQSLSDRKSESGVDTRV